MSNKFFFTGIHVACTIGELHVAVLTSRVLVLGLLLAVVLFLASDFSAAVAADPPPASEKILVKEIRITGNTVISTEELSLWTCCYVGDRVDLSELEGLADLLRNT